MNRVERKILPFMMPSRYEPEVLGTLPTGDYNVMAYDAGRHCLYLCNFSTQRVEKYDLATKARNASFISRAALLYLSYLPETDELVLGLDQSNAPVQVYDAGTGAFKRSFGSASSSGHTVYDGGRYFVAVTLSSASAHALRVYGTDGNLIHQVLRNEISAARGLTKAGGRVLLTGSTTATATGGKLESLSTTDPLADAMTVVSPGFFGSYQLRVSAAGYHIATRLGHAAGEHAVQILRPDLTLMESFIPEYATAIALNGKTVFALSRTGVLYKIERPYL